MSEQDYENMAVVGQVADIVHAFKEAHSYLKRIKERRRSKPPPRGLIVDGKALQDLEFALATGQETVRKQYERDYRRLGTPFATGDAQATGQLKSILTDLQRGLVAHLKFAYQHDQHIDFLPLQDVAADGQDGAVMCLMQLHQRVLKNGDPDEVVSGPSQTQQRPVMRHFLSEPTPSTSSSVKGSPLDFAPHYASHSPNDAHGHPLTPQTSPLGHSYTPIPHTPHDSQFRRPRVLGSTGDSNAISPSSLPTPPLDLIGPPPSAPLPPLPPNMSEKRHEARHAQADDPEYLRGPEKESQTDLDKTFVEVERAWDEEEMNRQEDLSRIEKKFHEPHPGTPVDPSRIGEPISPRSPAPPPPAPEFNIFPSPPTTKMSSSISLNPKRSIPQLRIPSRTDLQANADRPSTSGAVTANSPDPRISVYSDITQSSQSGSSAVYSMSRQTSMSSSHSWALSAPGSRQPSEGYGSPIQGSNMPVRTKSVAKVPDPIYENINQTDSQSTIKAADSRQAQQADSMPPPTFRPTFSAFPAVPAPPVIETPSVVTRRQSVVSGRSGSSSTPSSSTVTSAMPVRTIPPAFLNAGDPKANLPSDTNKYGGLCKGAWRAQIGDFKKAYSAEKKPAGMIGSKMVDYMRCRNCDFSGRVALDAKGKRGPDRKIIIAKESGLAYRWDFLFKSHLPVKGGVLSADAEYGCMFCCAEGRGTPVFKGMASFIAHVAEHRPGFAGSAVNADLQVPGGTVVDRMDAAVGRSMSESDRWEIAFPLPSGDGAYSDYASPLAAPPDARSMRSGISAGVY